MQIQKVQFKNFASYGNSIQTIEFDDKGYVYLVSGGNGYGKSTIANVIKFLLYGKVDGINLGDLPNRINGELWGKIELIANKKKVVIERGLKPNVFNVWINDKEYDQAGKSNTQEYLETEIFEIPYHVYRNIIILSINDFKSFLTMNPGDKKNIVDKMFGFNVINDMKDLVKSQRKEIKENIKTYEDELRILSDSIESVQNKIDEISKNSELKNKKKVKELKDKLQEIKESKKVLVEAKVKLESKIKDIEKEVQLKNKDKNEIFTNLKITKRKRELYDNKQCPTCGSSLETEEHLNYKEKLDKNLKEYPSKIESIEEDIKSLKEDINSNRQKFNKVLQKTSSLEANTNSLKKEIVSIVENMKKDNQYEYLNKLILEDNNKIDDRKELLSKKGNQDYFLQLIENILGEDGIKNLAMKTILPSLNSNIGVMLKEVHLPFNIKFDDKFNAQITSLGEEISPGTLSTGERKKSDFVIIIALIKMLKLRFPNLNLLFLDEIFSSVDADGIYSIIKILSKTIKEIDLNTFVINHSPLPSELFDKRINIYKNQGFSKFEVERIE
jgi:DNA repair exonuclease SbcCD ATPase subunit